VVTRARLKRSARPVSSPAQFLSRSSTALVVCDSAGERQRARARCLAGVLSVAAVRRVALDGLRTRRCATGWVQIVRVGMLRGSGGGETGYLLLDLGRLGVGGLGEYQCHRLDRQVAALNQPLVVLL
jgi:hypothetical protein